MSDAGYDTRACGHGARDRRSGPWAEWVYSWGSALVAPSAPGFRTGIARTRAIGAAPDLPDAGSSRRRQGRQPLRVHAGPALRGSAAVLRTSGAVQSCSVPGPAAPRRTRLIEL